MQIVKKDSFRSQGSAVNKTDDMYRVVVDMTRTEYPQFAKQVEENNKASAPCKWQCSCGQEVVGDYCKCGAYRCDL